MNVLKPVLTVLMSLLLLGLSACASITSEEDLRLIPENTAADAPTLEQGLKTGDSDTRDEADAQQ